MKRSSYVQLSLATSISLAIAGCDDGRQNLYNLEQKFRFQSVQECVSQQFPVDVCSDAYMAALAEHRRIAPVYERQADCEADFVPGYCQTDSAGRYVPQLGGFELTASGAVTQAQMDSARAQAGASGGSLDGLLMGMLIGNLMSGVGGGRYYSEPVYRYRDGRGAFSTSTLGRRIEQGATFPSSQQSRYGQGYSRSTGKPISTSAATSRGGFGSQSSARSGWGGSSSVGG
ncbi:DUF1190 domain-containing protein [Azotobacter salinestris]|uniref:DUF1190 domain-containing protein n=1 Tax=Azotobacter salinestris TaxID=69964 RepID=UPI0032DEC8B8